MYPFSIIPVRNVDIFTHFPGEASRESFNDWGERGYKKYVPVLGGDGTKIVTLGDLFDQPPGEMN